MVKLQPWQSRSRPGVQGTGHTISDPPTPSHCKQPHWTGGRSRSKQNHVCVYLVHPTTSLTYSSECFEVDIISILYMVKPGLRVAHRQPQSHPAGKGLSGDLNLHRTLALRPPGGGIQGGWGCKRVRGRTGLVLQSGRQRTQGGLGPSPRNAWPPLSCPDQWD